MQVPTIKEWDDPETIVHGCIDAQMKLISGFKGSLTTNLEKFEESEKPKHAAISLIGEPTLYPRLPELISEFHKEGMTTFLVTNGTNPDLLAEVNPTQLYLSLAAPDRDTYYKVCNPIQDYWDHINESLEVMRNLKCRTAIRITLVDGLNIKDPEKYAELLEKAKPNFIEVKAYMHLGFSRKRLNRSDMPQHGAVKAFAKEIASEISYKVVDEVEISRITLLANGTKLEIQE